MLFLAFTQSSFNGDLADRDYGCRDFRIKDNNGNMLIIGHALKNKTEFIKQITRMAKG